MARETVPLRADETEIELKFSLDRSDSIEDLPERARPGERCPICGKGTLDYDGMLNLVCPVCKFAEGGCFT